MPVRQVAAMRQVHTQNRIARLQNREINGHVGLAPGMWLHIGMLRSKQFFGAFNGQVFHDIDKFATAVITPPRIAFCVFISENRAGRFQYGLVGKVF